MRLVLDAACVAPCVERYAQRLDAQAPAGRAARRARGNALLPADVLHVGLQPQRGGRLRLVDELHLDRLEALGLARGAGELAVFHPGHPADVLHVHAVHDVVRLRDVARQLYPNALEAKRPPGRARHLAVALPILPAHILHVGLVGDAARRARQADVDALEAQRPSRGAGNGTIGAVILPSVVLHVHAVADLRRGSLRGQGRIECDAAGGEVALRSPSGTGRGEAQRDRCQHGRQSRSQRLRAFLQNGRHDRPTASARSLRSAL